VTKSGQSGRPFAWKLTRTTDTFGNLIEYRYARDAVQADGPHSWDQLYLDEIRYGDYGGRRSAVPGLRQVDPIAGIVSLADCDIRHTQHQSQVHDGPDVP
jgi:hypothetical protein